MKKFIFGLAIASIGTLSSCIVTDNKKDDILDSIHTIETEIFENTENKIETLKGIELIELYQKWAEAHPNDEQSPKFLLKGADIAIHIKEPGKAMVCLKKIEDNFSEFEKMDCCCFLKAHLYEDHFQDYEKAKACYEEIIEKYPDSDFADDAQASIQNLGLTPEQLIQKFQEKNKTN
ncbi:MAG: tol-pal system YbgF family protein [Hyphomicrobiales bacterium]